jgi:RimJ/RimL family protein N-acetyltransferase
MFVRTDRLLLRPGWPEDAEALLRGIADAGIVRNLASAPWPYRLADAEAFLATEREASAPAFLIFRRTDRAPELIGSVGFGRRPDGELEFGYWIARDHWCRGYATEAGEAALALGRHSLKLARIHAGHFLDNPASGRVLQKLGFRLTGVVAPRFSAGRGAATPCALYELALPREEQPREPEPAAAVELIAA